MAMDWKLIYNADMMQNNCPVQVRDLNVRDENIWNHMDFLLKATTFLNHNDSLWESPMVSPSFHLTVHG